MTQPDLRTRTAEAPTPSPQFISSLGDGSSPARTEVLQGSKLDTAAVSFAQERERVMQRSSHSKAVRQLRTALTAGAFVWASAALMDLLVARYAGDADLETLLANRAAGTLICVVALWRLWREPEPSVRVMRACDVLTYTGIAVCISLNIKLLDFGIAKATTGADSTLTNTGFIAGTPAYMAPEMIQGHAADRRTDIYSFGAMLYYAASGRLPFGDTEPNTLFAAHLTRAPAPLTAVAAHPMPEPLARVIERCMAKNPDERYPSTQALLGALQPLAASA